MTTLTTYEDKAAIQRREAITEGVSKITELQLKIDDARDDIQSGFVSVVNAMRSQGLELMRMADREQIAFSFFNGLGQMPFDFETAKNRISLAKKLPKPVKTFEEAREVYRSVFEQMNLLEVDATADGNRGVSHDPFLMALNAFVIIKQKFQKALSATPIEQCPRDMLKTLVADTQWAVEINQQARDALDR